MYGPERIGKTLHRVNSISIVGRRIGKLLRPACFCGVLVFLAGNAQATMKQIIIDQVFSGSVTPTGSQPWLTAIFEDTGLPPGEVKVTLSVTGLVQPEKVDEWDFNVDNGSTGNPAIDPTTLAFSAPTKTGTFDDPTINTGINAFKADGDGKYDIQFMFSTANGHEFGAGESVMYTITGPASLTAESFSFLSQPAGGAGPFYSAAHILSIGQGGNSVWASPISPPGTPAPEPAAIVLGLMAGCAAIGLRRWQGAC